MEIGKWSRRGLVLRGIFVPLASKSQTQMGEGKDTPVHSFTIKTQAGRPGSSLKPPSQTSPSRISSQIFGESPVKDINLPQGF